jgi:hypothetical protein
VNINAAMVLHCSLSRKDRDKSQKARLGNMAHTAKTFVPNKYRTEKRREFNPETHIVFIDYEKAFDRVNRATLWQIMERRGYPRHLICVTKSLYQNTTIILDMEGRYSKDIKINQGVRRGCSLSPTLFNIYLDDVIQEFKMRSNPGIWLKEIAALNTLLFADNQIIIQDLYFT